MGIDQVRNALTLVKASMGVTLRQFEFHDEVGRFALGLLVALVLEGEGDRLVGARLDDSVDAGGFLLDCAAVKTDDLARVADGLDGAAVELAEGNIDSDVDVGHGGGCGLVQASEGGAEEAALELATIDVA